MLFDSLNQFLSRSPEFPIDLFFSEERSELVKSVLDRTQKWHQRACVLQAPIVLWFVVAMTTFRAYSLASILKLLLCGMRNCTPDLCIREITPEAVCHARKKLGVAPIKMLFEAVAECARKRCETSFKGFRVWAIDGVRFLIPDTQSNEDNFGRPKASRGRAAFPQLLAVALVDVTNRLIGGCVLRRSDGSEREAARELLSSLGSGDLVLMDRGFSCAHLMAALRERSIRFLIRIPASWKIKAVGCNGNSQMVALQRRVPLSPAELKFQKFRSGRTAKTKEIEVRFRMVTYSIGAEESVRLLTNVAPDEADDRELAVLYHQRWEAELAFDEIKTHLATVSHGTLHTVLRSKTADGIRQEAFGLFVAFNFLRDLIVEGAQERRRSALQVSFVESLRLVQGFLTGPWSGEPSDFARSRRQLLSDISACHVRGRRPRRYPRKVKVKMSNYGLKTSAHVQEHFDWNELLHVQTQAAGQDAA